MNETPYEKWKAGKKIFKAPWVIRYYENVTDFNQYKLGRMLEARLALIFGSTCFISGFIFSYLIFG